MKTLYRPVGEKEMLLIAEGNFKKFPPRLEWQPIFYPVLNKEYAVEIASKWNTNDEFGNYLGFVTEFDITEEEFNKYKIQNVGSFHHNELWIPAEALENFNDAILEHIRVVDVFKGEKFKKLMNDGLLDLLHIEFDIHKERLHHFLETKSRTILPFSHFEHKTVHEENIKMFKGNFVVLKEKASRINAVDEAVNFLIEECLSDEYIQKIQNETPFKPIRHDIRNHFGINMFLRNLFFYQKNEKLQQSIHKNKSALGGSFGEHGEGIIGNILWKRIHNCEIANSPNKLKIETLQKQVDDFQEIFFADRNLVIGKTTFEEWEPFMDEFSSVREANKIQELEERINLLSYNFTEEQVDNYMSISKSDKTSQEKQFTESLILANVKEHEMVVAQKLRNVYVNILDVIEKLDIKT